MTTIVRVRFDGKVLIPEGQVDLPTDRVIELRVEENGRTEAIEPQLQKPRTVDEFITWVESLPPLHDSPGDGAAQHDHYLYGTPKRENP